MEFYFDFVSPYAYFASAKINSLAQRYGRQVTWKPVLIGVTILKVMGLKALTSTPLKSDYIAYDKPRMAKLLGIPFAQPDMRNVSSVNAMRAFLWISRDDPARATRFAHFIFERLWVHNMGISSDQDIAQACAAVEVDSQALLAGITAESGKEALRAAVEQAISIGVFGAPFFIMDGEHVWGVDRLWMVEHWLKHGNWDPQEG